MSEAPGSLVVFSDDWGRHPSSCQHIVKQWLPDMPVLWVNTIGMRPPSLSLTTVRRAVEKFRQWYRSKPLADELPCNLKVANPRMWPWFRSSLDRGLNRRLLRHELTPLINDLPGPVFGLTTVPITADLLDDLPVAKWTYYCVDDFSVWPGLDGRALRVMDEAQMRRVDELVVVSENLGELAARRGRNSHLLTHGVDVEHFRRRAANTSVELPVELESPVVLFWGVIDQRLDVEFLRSLSMRMEEGTILLAGPIDEPRSEALNLPRVQHLPPVAFEQLPVLAARAGVLVMPYVDQPVTRAMQPLKLKEYLATDRPVIVRRLPSTEPWSDCLDIALNADEFAGLVTMRCLTGLPVGQFQARRRIQNESWSSKSAQMMRWMRDALPCERSGSEPLVEVGAQP